jgi:hypothetical protein
MPKGLPEFYAGDKVEALNYRRRPAVWEPAEVSGGRTNWHSRSQYHHQYIVKLTRRARSGEQVFLTVGPDRIRKL